MIVYWKVQEEKRARRRKIRKRRKSAGDSWQEHISSLTRTRLISMDFRHYRARRMKNGRSERALSSPPYRPIFETVAIGRSIPRQTDHVQMPAVEKFDDPRTYYAVLAHELTHWTAAPALDGISCHVSRRRPTRWRSLLRNSGAFICADLQLENEPRPDHAAYLAGWLKVLEDDKKAIFTAASKAQAASDWMHEYQKRLAA